MNTHETASRDPGHRWEFFRAGGFDQVKLRSGADLLHLDELDQKLWVALACPTKGLECDSKTLDLIDTDKDGRIRAPEIIAATKLACARLRNPDDLLQGADSLPLSAINDATPEGKQLLASAKQILVNLGRPNASEISVADTTDTVKIFAQTNFNGDGIVPADAADDDTTKAVIKDIIACFGAETDRSGKPGVNQAKLDQFFAEARAYADWYVKATGDEAILPLGDATAPAAAAVQAVLAKVDDYFARCRLAAFDVRAIGALNREEKEYLALVAKDLTISMPELVGFPLAHVEGGRPLPLSEGVNPAWAAALATFRGQAVQPLLGDRPALTEADWDTVKAKLAAYNAWIAAKSGATVEKLGIQRLREILAGKSQEEIAALIARDNALEPEANAIANVDRLARYYRDLYLLCTNFVNFQDFYDRGEAAIFQAGTLYLDQRSCDLTLMIEDASKHATMASLAGAYLAYCECTRKSTGEKRLIVAAFTDGDSDNLMLGRNGIYYDRQGRDWDATIIKIVDNPISLRESFWSPYKKFVRLIEEQVAKRAAAAEAASGAKLTSLATTVTTADKTPPAAAKKMDVGTVAAIGVAFGAIGTFFATLLGYVTGVIKLGPLAIVAAIIGVLLLISGPSMIIAYVKLRKRNLGPILDGNGWAVNARVKINVPFGAALTGIAKMPSGSKRQLIDPYAESHRRRNTVIVLAFIAAILFGLWRFNLLNPYLPDGWQHQAPVPTDPTPENASAPTATQ